MRILRWVGGSLGALVAVVLLLDTFGGYFLDGPIGPIPGGRLQGAVTSESNPDWSTLEKVIELEVRPEKPWSLSVWNAVVDGELYVPSAKGEKRRWTQVALKDPRVRVRTGGRIYEQKIVRLTDPELSEQVRGVLAERYELSRDSTAEDDGLWLFHITSR